ncbi:MAG: SDR family oxidoreductase [Salinarimonas sp.]
MIFSLANRTALVTGASRGLGRAIAVALAQAGAHVIVNGRDAGRLAPVVQAIKEAGGSARACAFDIADGEAREHALADLEAGDIAVDILVNNVGRRHRRPVSETDHAAFLDLLDADLAAPYALTRALVPAMIARGAGRIINICSIAGPRARPNDAAYTAAKGGLAALTRAMAMEFAPHGILVNGIAPGFFATETNEAMTRDPKVQRFVEEHIPLGRWGEPHEIAGAAVFLASDAASYVNGHILTVDAGLSVSF